MWKKIHTKIPRLLKFKVNRSPIHSEFSEYTQIVQYSFRDFHAFLNFSLLHVFIRIVSLETFISAYANTLDDSIKLILFAFWICRSEFNSCGGATLQRIRLSRSSLNDFSQNFAGIILNIRIFRAFYRFNQ